MPSITLTVTQDWSDRFGDYARDADPWEGAGADPRNPAQLFREWVTRNAKYNILNYERNLRAETGGRVLPDPT